MSITIQDASGGAQDNQDFSVRKGAWARSNSTIVGVAQAVPHGGVIYEPYPVWHEFAIAAVIAKAAPGKFTGTAAISFAGRAELFSVDSLTLSPRESEGFVVQAHSGCKKTVLRFVGAPEPGFERLEQQAKQILGSDGKEQLSREIGNPGESKDRH
ncbi:MAG: hypothetical protein HZA51_16585 [Planctomycetes bacterium]|nr:hypothetical protein [Planctomycetota bacterium]